MRCANRWPPKRTWRGRCGRWGRSSLRSATRVHLSKRSHARREANPGLLEHSILLQLNAPHRVLQAFHEDCFPVEVLLHFPVMPILELFNLPVVPRVPPVVVRFRHDAVDNARSG